MNIAVTYQNGSVFQHFGHTEQFKLYRVQDARVSETEILYPIGSGHGALAGFLSANDVQVLICGGIGAGAQTALMQAGIRLYAGVHGDADAAVQAFLEGRLQFDPNTKCDHHHGNEGHACGEHGCGHGDCGSHRQ